MCNVLHEQGVVIEEKKKDSIKFLSLDFIKTIHTYFYIHILFLSFSQLTSLKWSMQHTHTEHNTAQHSNTVSKRNSFSESNAQT